MTDEGEIAPGSGEGSDPFEIDAGRPRKALNLLRRAVGQGWPIGQDTKDRAVPVLEKLAFDPMTDDRSRLKAIEIIRMMAKDNVEAAVALDRIERLETGNVTERVEFKPMEF